MLFSLGKKCNNREASGAAPKGRKKKIEPFTVYILHSIKQQRQMQYFHVVLLDVI